MAANGVNLSVFRGKPSKVTEWHPYPSSAQWACASLQHAFNFILETLVPESPSFLCSISDFFNCLVINMGLAVGA